MPMKRWTLVMGVTLLVSWPVPLLATEPPATQPPPVQSSKSDAVWLRQGTWSEDEREQYYHLTSGTQLIPYSWFLALEQADTADPFKADANITQLHFVPGKAHPLHNRDRLPEGFTKTVYPDDPRGIKEYLGVTCAFCHTGELHVSTKDRGRLTVYIDGGASMQDNAQFLDALSASFRRTAADQKKFSDFASAVLKERNDEASQERLKKTVAGLADTFAARAKPVRHWGFGRLDALNRGSNLAFGPLHPGNAKPMSAPVSIPPLWNVHLYDWVQWNGSFQNPLARNIAQVIGIGAGLFQNQDPGKPVLSERPLDPFVSSLDTEKLRRLEQMVSAIKPPHWPGEVFGRINEKLARQGKKLYRDNCKHCHVPELLGSPTQFGQRFKMNMIPAEEMGTDSEYLKFASRMIQTGVLARDFGSASLPASEAIERLTTTLMRRSILDPGPNEIEARPAFMARPHAGIWATPPFLHNGSIPTLYELLSPIEERTTCFYLGNLEYDPIKVGYVVRPCSDGEMAGGFRFDTKQPDNPGNSHAGHEFRKDDRAGRIFTKQECELFRTQGGKNGILGCEFTPAERSAITEYLKTCDLDDVTWDTDDTPKICEAPRVYLPE